MYRQLFSLENLLEHLPYPSESPTPSKFPSPWQDPAHVLIQPLKVVRQLGLFIPYDGFLSVEMPNAYWRNMVKKSMSREVGKEINPESYASGCVLHLESIF